MKTTLQPAARSARVCAWLTSLGLCLSNLSASAALAPQTQPLGSFGDSLQAPTRLAVDAAGQVYASDPVQNRVVVSDAFGHLVAVHENLAGPLGIAVDHQG